MSFSLFANIVTTILCLAVLVQSARMMRSLKAVQASNMDAVVTALDESTAQARMVLSNLKHTLEGDIAGSIKLVLEGREIRDELKMLIEIANSMAERLCDSSRPAAEPEPRPVASFEAPRPVARAPEPQRIEAEPEVEATSELAPIRRTPLPRATKPMDKEDIAASLAALRAVLSRQVGQTSDTAEAA